MAADAGFDIGALAAEIGAHLDAMPDHVTERVRALRRGYSARLAHAPPESVVSLALRLLDRPDFESRFVAYELISHHRGALRRLDLQLLEQLGVGMGSWQAVDTFACYLAGPAWRERQVTDDAIYGWSRSPDRWWRRAALVSTVPLNNKARGGRGDIERTLTMCRLLIDDRDDMVVKALSWALRELSKRDPGAAAEFVNAHEHVLATRVLREVRHKLTTGRKYPKTGGLA